MGVSGSVVLAVFAHPDDESLACGGTLARLAQEGAHVVVMCATRGERGSHDSGLLDTGLGKERAREMRDAALALGISEVHLFAHPDGDMRWAQVALFNAELVLFMRHRRPAAVITFGDDGLYWHPDHIGVYERVLTATRSLGSAAPPLYHVSIPQGVMPAIVQAAQAHGWTAPTQGFWSLAPSAFGQMALPHTLALDVTPLVARKRAALAAHRSQMGDSDPFTLLSTAEAERWLGTEYFRRASIPGIDTRPLEQLCTPSS